LITWDVVFLLPSGASRYLYLASAGTAFGSAWALRTTARFLTRLWAERGQAAAVGILVLLCVSSYFSLRHAAALSLYSSARNYVARGDSETGIEVLKRLFASPYRDAVPEDEAYFLLCSAMPFLGENPAPYLAAALVRFPDHIGLQTIAAALDQQHPLADVRQRGEQQMEAIYQQSVTTGQDQHFLRNLAAIYHNIGLSHAVHGDYQAAERVMTRTLQIHPNRPNTRRILGRTYLQWAATLEDQGQEASARSAYQRALTLDSLHVEAHLGLGHNFYRTGLWNQASAQYRKVLQIEQNSHAWFGLGLSELAVGDAAQGRRTLLQALAVFGFAEAGRVGAIAELEAFMGYRDRRLAPRVGR
jgi:tetratricopeptide (TPR) repeat protein